MSTVYNLVGATVGTAKGLSETGQREAVQITAVASRQFKNTLSNGFKSLLLNDLKIQKVYTAAGALRGVIDGIIYAVHCIWWNWTGDEVKLRLVQGSPVKYRLRDLSELVQANPEAFKVKEKEPPRPPVTVAPAVKNGGDHLATTPAVPVLDQFSPLAAAKRGKEGSHVRSAAATAPNSHGSSMENSPRVLSV